MKLLLDENITPAAVRLLREDGVDAWHVRDRRLEGSSDSDLLDRAYDEDRILVTLNVGDFEKLVRRRELHAGIVLVERVGLLRDEQIELVRNVAVAISNHGGLVNEILRVAEDGTFSFENLTV